MPRTKSSASGVKLAAGGKMTVAVGAPSLEASMLVASAPVPDPRAERTRIEVRGEMPSPTDPPSGCRFRTRCPRADDLCSETEPELVDAGDGQFVACHHPMP